MFRKVQPAAENCPVRGLELDVSSFSHTVSLEQVRVLAWVYLWPRSDEVNFTWRWAASDTHPPGSHLTVQESGMADITTGRLG
jgi:hypothetical protein